MQIQEYDVLVIGAGAAGLMGALEIASAGYQVAVIEAKDRIGRRIFTLTEAGDPIELGAEFVHGNLAVTKNLMEKAGISVYPLAGNIWQHTGEQWQKQDDFIKDYDSLEKKFKELKEDKSVEMFLREDLRDSKYQELRFSVKNYVEGYYAADIRKASTMALCGELANADDEQYRVQGGYGLMVDYLEKKGKEKGVTFFLSQPVLQVQWKKNKVVAITHVGTYKAKKLLITIPVGVLQKEAISFFPGLPRVKDHVQRLGFGHVVKVITQFKEAFWKTRSHTNGKDLAEADFLFSEETIPAWWTNYPGSDARLTGWIGGPEAKKLQFLKKKELQTKALTSLSRLFHIEIIQLEQTLTGFSYHNWSADDHFNGAYSFEVVGGGEAIHFLQQPVEGTLFFAGEGIHRGPEIGTVEGALQSGKEAAHRLIACSTI